MTEQTDAQLRDAIQNPAQSVVLVAAGGKVKMVQESVLLTSAYSLGWRDCLRLVRERLMAATGLDENARAEAIAAVEEDR